MNRLVRLTLVSILMTALGTGVALAKPKTDRNSAWLGVYTQSVNDEIAEGFKLPVKSGAIINEIVEDSPADEAGLRDNDIVIAIDGSKIETSDNLITYIQGHSAGDVVTLKILRDGKEREFKVTLAKRPEPERRIERTFAFKSPDDPDRPDELDEPDHPDNVDDPDARIFKFYSETISDSYIGVELTTLSDQLKEYFGVTGDGGVLISSVQKETPAEKAGLKAGDVIIKADGDEVADAGDVREVVADKDKGEQVELTLVRDHKEMTLSVEVAENKHAGIGRKAMRTFTMPDIGHAPSPNMPRMKGLWYGTEDHDKNSDDLRDELKELRAQLKELRQQLDELKESRK